MTRIRNKRKKSQDIAVDRIEGPSTFGYVKKKKKQKKNIPTMCPLKERSRRARSFKTEVVFIVSETGHRVIALCTDSIAARGLGGEEV